MRNSHNISKTYYKYDLMIDRYCKGSFGNYSAYLIYFLFPMLLMGLQLTDDNRIHYMK